MQDHRGKPGFGQMVEDRNEEKVQARAFIGASVRKKKKKKQLRINSLRLNNSGEFGVIEIVSRQW